MKKFLTLACATLLTPTLAQGAFQPDSRYQDQAGVPASPDVDHRTARLGLSCQARATE